MRDVAGFGLISVVCPIYRNADTVHELVARLHIVLKAIAPFEIVLVNDACPAGSSAVLAAIAAADPRIMVVTHSRNAGQNAAILTGLRHAAGDALIVMDADLQDPPEAIPSLLERLRSPVAVVFAAREGEYHASPIDRLSSLVFKALFRALSGGRIPAGAGLFLAMNRDMAERMIAEADGWPYLIGFMVRTGLQLAAVPTRRALRTAGRSAYTGWRRLSLAWKALIYTYTPLAGRHRPPRPEVTIFRAASAPSQALPDPPTMYEGTTTQ